MLDPNLNPKTVFLLDHCVCMKESGGISIEIDTGSSSSASSKSQPGTVLPFAFVPPVTKKLWTYVVENSLEYARIVYDLFSDTRPLRFVLNDPSTAYALNSWKSSEQTLSFISEAFAVAGCPEDTGGSLAGGIKTALQNLSQPTQAQRALLRRSSQKVRNCGRVICVTSVLKDEGLEDLFERLLVQHNENVASADHLLSIEACEFTIVSVHPVGKEHNARILRHGLEEKSALLSTEVVVTTTENITDTFVKLCVAHNDLVSLTVTGIPMKEEQKAQASSNYDVMLFHPRMTASSSDSLVLKWSTPYNKPGTEASLHPCNSVVRITPVDIHSRPSVCLSNFVIGGRSVNLESPKKGRAAPTHNHTIIPHGGEMWMHSIESTKNIEDPPSISEGIGGRVTDYRIPDFVGFMKQNTLVPCQRHKLKADSLLSSKELNEDAWTNPKEAAKNRLWRKTEFWPLTISGSILFPMSVHLKNLLELMPVDILTDADKQECDKTLWALMAVEARGDSPPVPSPSHKKGHKREEQWRMVYAEVETFIRANLYSENHRKVLECFLASRQRDDVKSVRASKKDDKKDEKVSLKNSTNTIYPRNNAVIEDSPMSPDDSNSGRRDSWGGAMDTRKTNLASLWYLKNTKKDLRSLPTDYKLYSHLKTDDKSEKVKKEAL